MNTTFSMMPGSKTIGNYIISNALIKIKVKIWGREHSVKLSWVYITKRNKKSPLRSYKKVRSPMSPM